MKLSVAIVLCSLASTTAFTGPLLATKAIKKAAPVKKAKAAPAGTKAVKKSAAPKVSVPKFSLPKKAAAPKAKAAAPAPKKVVKKVSRVMNLAAESSCIFCIYLRILC